jgi:hypothetical protein
VDFDNRIAKFIRFIPHHRHGIQLPIKNLKFLGTSPYICPTPWGKSWAAMKPHATTIDHDQLQTAVAAAKDRFSLLRKKYPAMKAYLVLAIPGKQTGIGSSTREILRDLPALVVDDPAKADIQRHLKSPPPKEAGEKAKKEWEEQFDDRVRKLRYDGDVQVEIRFDSLNYELIHGLQTDELVDRSLTPQTRASIRVVLGTLSGFLS